MCPSHVFTVSSSKIWFSSCVPTRVPRRPFDSYRYIVNEAHKLLSFFQEREGVYFGSLVLVRCVLLSHERVRLYYDHLLFDHLLFPQFDTRIFSCNIC